MVFWAFSRYPNPTKTKFHLQKSIPIFGNFWLGQIVNYLPVRFLQSGMPIVNMKQELKSQ
jgi:hypothetical protein